MLYRCHPQLLSSKPRILVKVPVLRVCGSAARKGSGGMCGSAPEKVAEVCVKMYRSSMIKKNSASPLFLRDFQVSCGWKSLCLILLSSSLQVAESTLGEVVGK